MRALIRFPMRLNLNRQKTQNFHRSVRVGILIGQGIRETTLSLKDLIIQTLDNAEGLEPGHAMLIRKRIRRLKCL